jgi:hypothetical protein
MTNILVAVEYLERERTKAMKLELREEIQPICPHCQTEITTLWYRELRGPFGRRYIYFCSQCRKALGVSHRKGFWMG